MLNVDLPFLFSSGYAVEIQLSRADPSVSSEVIQLVMRGYRMFGSITKMWSMSGVNVTLTNAGLNKQIAQSITKALPKDAWALIQNCTNNLNPQCKNLCNSMFVAALYQILYKDSMGWELENELGSVIRNILGAVEYQSEMGHKVELDESQRRFEYMGEKYYGG
jgi:hypothetical protein